MMALFIVEEWVGKVHNVFMAVDVGHGDRGRREETDEKGIDGRQWRHPRQNHKTIYIQDRSLIKWPISNGSYLDPYLSIKPFTLTVLRDFFLLTYFGNSSHNL